MFKFYVNKESEKPNEYSYVSLGNNFYKVTMRKEIEDKSSPLLTGYNECSIIINHDNEATLEDLIKENFNTYYEQAVLQEELDYKEKRLKYLESELSNSDYKVLKNLENYILGMTLPYEFSTLIYNRQKIRDKINNIDNISNLSELEQAKSRKIKEMSAVAQSTIINGITIEGKNYSLNITDQINLMFGLILSNLIPELSVFPYHANDRRCELFEMTDIKLIAVQGILFKTYHTTYYNLLKCEIMESDSIDFINSIYYGIDLSKDEDKEILNNIQSLMGGVFKNEENIE